MKLPKRLRFLQRFRQPRRPREPRHPKASLLAPPSQTEPPGPPPEPKAPDALRQPCPTAETDPGIYSDIALAVLAVTDQMTSGELKRRLAEALLPLPAVRLIMPNIGDRFDPHLHEAVGVQPAPTSAAIDTVAETYGAGLIDHTGALRRFARVGVYAEVEGSKP